MNNKELQAETEAQQSKNAELLLSSPLLANPMLGAVLSRQEKRKDFEKAKWVRNTVDLMHDNPLAEKDCKGCDGHGVVEETCLIGGILENCSNCWR